MRRILLAILIATATSPAAMSAVEPPLAAAAAKKKKPACGAFRFIPAFDAFEAQFAQDNIDFSGAGRNSVRKLCKRLSRRSTSLKAEARFAYALVHGIRTAPDPRDKSKLLFGNQYEPSIADVFDGFDERAVQELERAELFVEYLKQDGFDTTKEEKALERMRGGLPAARRLRPHENFLFSLTGFFFQARKIRLMARTATKEKQKKCKGRKLKGAEFCNAILGGTVEHFDLGQGEIMLDRDGNPSRLRITFTACPTKSHLPHTIQFTVPTTLGIDEGPGGFYTRSDGSGFGQAFRSAQVKITGINLDAGYVAGEFEFTTKTTVCKSARFTLFGLK